MPDKSNAARRHTIPRARCKSANWPDLYKALQQRSSLQVWVTLKALAAWCPPHTGGHGRPRDCSDVAIETGHLCCTYSMLNRMTKLGIPAYRHPSACAENALSWRSTSTI